LFSACSCNFRFSLLRPSGKDVPGGQRAIDEASETRRSRALDQVVTGLQGLEKKKKEQTALDLKATQRKEDKALKADVTKRQRAVGGLNFEKSLADQGISLTPEQSGDVAEAFETGKFTKLSAVLGKSAEAKKLISDEERAFKKSERALSSQLKRGRISKLQAEAEDRGKPFAETRAGQKAAAKAKITRENKPLSKDQKDSATFAARVDQSEQDFEDIISRGFDRTELTSAAGTFLPEGLKSENLKLQEQAENNFITAILRRESGAAISDAEFERAEIKFFPRAGDTPAVLAQKKRNRDIELQGLKAGAGERAMSAINERLATIPQAQEVVPQPGDLQQFQPEQVAAQPVNFPIQNAQAGSLQPERVQARQSRLQELRAKAGQ